MAGMKKDNSVDILIWVLGGITLVLFLAAIVSILLMLR
jgi:hypothetical protein